MIRKASDIKLNVLPLAANMEHLYYYEGPCRFGKGDALQVGFDRLANAQKAKVLLDNINKFAPPNTNILDLVFINRTDNWDDPEEQWERLAKAVQDADVVVSHARIGIDELLIEFVQRFNKPIIFTPEGISGMADVTALRYKPEKNYQVFAVRNWKQVTEYLAAFRAVKVIKNTNMLLATRFGNTVSFSSVDSFNNFELITSRLGARFRFMNAHELLDQMSPAVEGGNHTTPGRETPDLTEEDMAEVKALADELMGGAEETEVAREYLENSLKAYVTVKKNLDLKDCNAFTIPCPDVCSTRRLNEMKFTFCLTHALLTEQGIPSACEYDVSCALSEQALIAVSGMSPYMGNAYPAQIVDGKVVLQHADPEELEKLSNNPENLYAIQHSVAHRRMADPTKNGPYALRHFAQDQEFGAIMRYDWNRDEGKTVTTCRFSPDGAKLFIGKGTIAGGAAYHDHGCSGPVVIRVKDIDDFFEKQLMVGMHLPIVYGDYTKELKRMAMLLGIETIEAL